MAIAGKAKTKLENGVRVNIADNSFASPSTSRQAKTLARNNTVDNDKTNAMVDKGLLPESRREIYPQGSINSSTLSPKADFNLTAPALSTKADGLMGAFEAGADQFTQNIARQRAEAASLKENSLGDYTDALANQLTESGATADAYGQKGGVDDIQSELDTINNQLLQEQNANRRRIEALDKNAPGMLRSQVQAEQQRVNTESLRRQADLSVIQMGIQGRFDSAKSIADRAVDAILEGERNRLESLRVNYEENKELFSTADQRAFETAQNDRERKLNSEENRLKEINNVALTYLQEGGSASTAQQIMGAKTVAEAVGMTGGVIGRSARIQNAINQAKYDEIQNALNNPQALDADTREAIGKSDITKETVTRISLVKNLSELRSLIKEHGTKNILDADAAGKIAALRSQLEIDIAVAGGQGAISGEEATRYANIVGGGFTDRQTKVISQIDQAVSTENGKIKSGIGLLEATYEGAGNFEPFVEYISDVELQDYLDSELKVLTPQEAQASAIENWLLGTLPSTK